MIKYIFKFLKFKYPAQHFSSITTLIFVDGCANCANLTREEEEEKERELRRRTRLWTLKTVKPQRPSTEDN